MIQFTEALADAYVRPARNVAMPSLPGRQVRFLQGHAVIKDGRDLAAMLRRADVKLVMLPFAQNWIDQIMTAAGQVRAEVLWPEGAPKPRNPQNDPKWPRDPITHRFLKRKLLEIARDGPDRADADPGAQ
jgi:hypothetical protein